MLVFWLFSIFCVRRIWKIFCRVRTLVERIDPLELVVKISHTYWLLFDFSNSKCQHCRGNLTDMCGSYTPEWNGNKEQPFNHLNRSHQTTISKNKNPTQTRGLPTSPFFYPEDFSPIDDNNIDVWFPQRITIFVFS